MGIPKVFFIILNSLPADVVLMALAVIYHTAGITTLDQMLKGFSDSGVMCVAILCVVAKAVELSGLMLRSFIGL